MRVDDQNDNFSNVLHSIKRNFTFNYKSAHNISGSISIWQRGFWDHVIRDERDLNRHFDYIHWNPVKHGYVRRVADWPYSSFHRFVAQGVYPVNWGHSGDFHIRVNE